MTITIARPAGALLTTALVTAAACGGGDGSPSSIVDTLEPTLPTTQAANPSTGSRDVIPSTSQPSEGQTATEPERPPATPSDDLVDVPPTGPLQMDEIRSALFGAFQLTEDVMRSLSVFGPMPNFIPTLGEARIVELDLTTIDDDPEPYLDLSVTFLSASSQADLLAFYESSLVTNAYTLTASEQQVVDDVTVDTLRFADPNADPSFESRELSVSVSDVGFADLRLVTIDVVDDIDDIDPRRLTTWPAEVPGLDAIEFRLGRVVFVGDEGEVGLTAAAIVDDLAVVEQAVAASMPADGWSIIDATNDPSGDSRYDLERDGVTRSFLQLVDLPARKDVVVAVRMRLPIVVERDPVLP